MNDALRALNRFGLGARPGEQQGLGSPEQWLLEQLRPANALLRDSDLPDSNELSAALRSRMQQRNDQTPRRDRMALQSLLRQETEAALRHRLASPAPFTERLVTFWSNHLCISATAKIPTATWAGHYERTAIRPRVFGKYSDLVLASAQHPAMLTYLDNFQSVGPRSDGARRLGSRGRTLGLNENYARELLELHTLGVNGGYSQDDVENLALILTGWSLTGVGPLAERLGETRIGFTFRSFLHEPGRHEVLGRTYKNRGVEQGREVIRDLSRHPATAHHLATKLARHFVADDPPASAVRQLEKVFLDTDGDLAAVSRTLVRLPEAWSVDHRKFRSPQDWLVAAARALRLNARAEVLGELLRQLRQPLWSPAAPKGYGDTVADWLDPDGLMNRAELAQSIGARAWRQVPEPADLLDVIEVDAADPLRTFLHDKTISRAERLALTLGGPAFQWR